MKHHPSRRFTPHGFLPGQWTVASLTGAVSSQSVTEECKGGLKPDLSAVERKGICPPDG